MPGSVKVGRIAVEEDGRLAHRRLQLHGPRPRVRQRDSRPTSDGASAALRHAALCRAAFPLRPRDPPHRRPQRLGTEAACSWTKVPTTGGSSGSAGSWAGPASRSRPARPRPARFSHLCWAKAHGMTLMVQDLSNPMLAQIPHVASRRPRGHDHGRRDQRNAVLPRRLCPRPPFIPGSTATQRLSRPLDHSRTRLRLSRRGNRSETTGRQLFRTRSEAIKLEDPSPVDVACNTRCQSIYMN